VSVYGAVSAELDALACANSVEGQVALNLAQILDDRAGIQGGGVASTAKELGLIMARVRDEHKPQVATRLSVLRAAG
jgi:hypothetical protein